MPEQVLEDLSFSSLFIDIERAPPYHQHIAAQFILLFIRSFQRFHCLYAGAPPLVD